MELVIKSELSLPGLAQLQLAGAEDIAGEKGEAYQTMAKLKRSFLFLRIKRHHQLTEKATQRRKA